MKRSIAYLSTALLLAGTSLAVAQTQNQNGTSPQTPGMSQSHGSALGAQQASDNGSGAMSNSKSSPGAMSNSNSSPSAMSTQRSSVNRTASNAGTNSRQEVQQVQQALEQNGEHVRADGILGPRTRQALRDYQQKNGLQASGQLDQQTLQKLNVAGR